jgi:type I restriction-modification system DNA methylase subunit
LVPPHDTVDFNAPAAGQRILSDEQLRALAQVLSRHRLGLRDIKPDILGQAYEYLIRKSAEGQGQGAREFYTPREVTTLMARILDAEPGEEELSLIRHLVHVHSPTLLRDEKRTCLFCRPR